MKLYLKLNYFLHKPWKDKTADVVSVSKLMDVYKGHGDGDTRWKGCAWKLLLLKLDIIHN